MFLHDSFTKISRKYLVQLLKQDQLHVPEATIFKAVMRWGQEQLICAKEYSDVPDDSVVIYLFIFIL